MCVCLCVSVHVFVYTSTGKNMGLHRAQERTDVDEQTLRSDALAASVVICALLAENVTAVFALTVNGTRDGW